MRMIRHRRHPNIVNSPKTSTAIPAPTPVHRDLLIQAVLDPHVRSIEFVHRIVHRGRAVDARSVVLHRDDGRYLIDLVGTRPQRKPEEEEALELGLLEKGIQRREIDPQDIRREPRFGNAREIWKHRDFLPPSRDRERIMDALYSRGPQPISELEDAVGVSTDACQSACKFDGGGGQYCRPNDSQAAARREDIRSCRCPSARIASEVSLRVALLAHRGASVNLNI